MFIIPRLGNFFVDVSSYDTIEAPRGIGDDGSEGQLSNFCIRECS